MNDLGSETTGHAGDDADQAFTADFGEDVDSPVGYSLSSWYSAFLTATKEARE